MKRVCSQTDVDLFTFYFSRTWNRWPMIWRVALRSALPTPSMWRVWNLSSISTQYNSSRLRNTHFLLCVKNRYTNSHASSFFGTNTNTHHIFCLYVLLTFICTRTSYLYFLTNIHTRDLFISVYISNRMFAICSHANNALAVPM